MPAQAIRRPQACRQKAMLEIAHHSRHGLPSEGLRPVDLQSAKGLQPAGLQPAEVAPPQVECHPQGVAPRQGIAPLQGGDPPQGVVPPRTV